MNPASDTLLFELVPAFSPFLSSSLPSRHPGPAALVDLFPGKGVLRQEENLSFCVFSPASLKQGVDWLFFHVHSRITLRGSLSVSVVLEEGHKDPSKKLLVGQDVSAGRALHCNPTR